MGAKRSSARLMTCCSTRCIIGLTFACFQAADDAFGLAPGSALTVELRRERVEHGRQVGKQAFLPILCQIHHFESPALTFEQGIQVAEAKASHTILMLYDNQANRR